MGDSNLGSKGVIQRPIGGTYLKHIANVIVYLKNISTSTFLPRINNDGEIELPFSIMQVEIVPITEQAILDKDDPIESIKVRYKEEYATFQAMNPLCFRIFLVT